MSNGTRPRFLRLETALQELAVGLGMVVPRGEGRNQLMSTFPPTDSPLQFARFFATLYSVYDLRYTYMASSMA